MQLVAESFEQHVGTLTVPGSMSDMWRIYERQRAGAHFPDPPGGGTIRCHTLDLPLPPFALLADAQSLASNVRKVSLDIGTKSY